MVAKCKLLQCRNQVFHANFCRLHTGPAPGKPKPEYPYEADQCLFSCFTAFKPGRSRQRVGTFSFDELQNETTIEYRVLLWAHDVYHLVIFVNREEAQKAMELFDETGRKREQQNKFWPYKFYNVRDIRPDWAEHGVFLKYDTSSKTIVILDKQAPKEKGRMPPKRKSRAPSPSSDAFSPTRPRSSSDRKRTVGVANGTGVGVGAASSANGGVVFGTPVGVGGGGGFGGSPSASPTSSPSSSMVASSPSAASVMHPVASSSVAGFDQDRTPMFSDSSSPKRTRRQNSSATMHPAESDDVEMKNAQNFPPYNAAHPISPTTPRDYSMHASSSFSTSSSSTLSDNLRSYENRGSLFPQFGDHHSHTSAPSYHDDHHHHQQQHQQEHPDDSHSRPPRVHTRTRSDSGSGDLPPAHPAASHSPPVSSHHNSGGSGGGGAYGSPPDDPTLSHTTPSSSPRMPTTGTAPHTSPNAHARDFHDRKYIPASSGGGREHGASSSGSGGSGSGVAGRLQRHRASFPYATQQQHHHEHSSSSGGGSGGGVYTDSAIFKHFVEDMQTEIERLRVANASCRHENTQLRDKLQQHHHDHSSSGGGSGGGSGSGVYTDSAILKHFVEDMQTEIERLRVANASCRHENTQLRDKLTLSQKLNKRYESDIFTLNQDLQELRVKRELDSQQISQLNQSLEHRDSLHRQQLMQIRQFYGVGTSRSVDFLRSPSREPSAERPSPPSHNDRSRDELKSEQHVHAHSHANGNGGGNSTNSGGEPHHSEFGAPRAVAATPGGSGGNNGGNGGNSGGGRSGGGGNEDGFSLPPTAHSSTNSMFSLMAMSPSGGHDPFDLDMMDANVSGAGSSTSLTQMDSFS